MSETPLVQIRTAPFVAFHPPLSLSMFPVCLSTIYCQLHFEHEDRNPKKQAVKHVIFQMHISFCLYNRSH